MFHYEYLLIQSSEFSSEEIDRLLHLFHLLD